MAYQRWWKTIRDQQGNAVNGASVAVYNGGTGTLATVYDPNTDDSAPGGLANPFVTGANGVFGFMAADGEYDVQISGGNGATQQYRVRLDTLGQSADSLRSDLAASSGAGLVGHADPTLGDTTVENVLGMGGPNLNPYVTNIAGGPTLAASSGAGALTGTYAYVVTFLTATGETEAGGESGSITVTAKNIELSLIPVSSDPAVIGRRIYRSFTGNKDPVIKKLVTTINDNTTTTYTDSTPDGSLGVFCPRLNTTGANAFLDGVRGFYYGPGTCASFGHDTMNNSTGYANSAFGPQSMQYNTTGFRNCAFGIYSLNLNTTGARNSAFGVHALNNNITADDNTAFGYGAAINTNNFSNCAFGAYTLQSNVTGVENCAFGVLALQANTGSGNTAFGHSAGYTNIGGAFNAYFGFKAGYTASTANFCTAVGHSALYYNVSGAGNTAVGNYALEDVTGAENTGIGRFAGRNLTGANNTIIGSTAMQTAVAASGNVCIGFQAGYYETGSDKLFIDNNAHASEADARLKALIYGIFNQYDTNAQFLYLNARVAIKENVGFYGTNPAVKQTVTGSRGGNAALASLLTALANYGLITDSSTA